MQQCLQLPAGDRPYLLSNALSQPAPAHRGVMLIGRRGTGRIDSALGARILERLLAPAAQVEGVDYHLGDAGLLRRAEGAQSVLMLLPPLGNLSNSFYRVHPRRNDRFVAARAPLRALYPEVDFALFDFTGHVLGTLRRTSPERFAVVRQVLVETWCQRMRLLLEAMPRQGALLRLTGPGYLSRPAVPWPHLPVLTLSADDKAGGVAALRAALLPQAA